MSNLVIGMKKKIPISLGIEEQKKIKKIQEFVTKKKILHFPKEEDNLILQIDAPELFWSGVLIDNTNKIIAYTLRKFTKCKSENVTYDKELLAIKLAIKSLKIYQLNRVFIIETNN